MKDNATVAYFASKRARENLLKKKRDEQAAQEKFLNELAVNSKSCFEASNTARLVSENWDDDKQNYDILTKLNAKKKRRIDDILRYGVPR